MTKFTLLFLFGFLSCVYAKQIPGGISDTEIVADDDVKSYVSKTSADIKTKAAAALISSDGGSAHSSNIFDDETPTALAYKTQIVAGTNYFIKTKIGNYIFIVKIYKNLEGNLSVENVTGPRKESDPIEYV